MSIPVVCPSCSAKLNAPDAAAGKKVKCPKTGCGAYIEVSEPMDSGFEEVEENTAPKPATKKTVKATVIASQTPEKSDRNQDLREDDDELPRSKRRKDDDKTENRPRKKKRKKSGGNSPLIMSGIAAGGILIIALVGFGIYKLTAKDSKPDSAASSSSTGAGASSNPSNPNPTLTPMGESVSQSSSATNSHSGTNATAKAPVPKGWVEFKSNSDGFKAFFPGKPVPSIDSKSSMYLVGDTKLKSVFSILIVQLEMPPTRDNDKKMAARICLKNSLESLGAKFISMNVNTTLAELPSTEMLFEMTHSDEPPNTIPPPNKPANNAPSEVSLGRGVFRAIYNDKKVYLVGVSCETGMPSSELINAFFDNFELVK